MDEYPLPFSQRILTYPERCSGCRICELICAFTKHEEFNPKRSRIRIVKMERFFVDIPVLCKQCPNPSCMEECPAGAISKDVDHFLHLDEKLCTSCGRCIEACPYGAISIDPFSQTAVLCDLCGGEPQCVKWCPTRALELSRTCSPSQRKRWNAVSSTVKSLLEKWGIPHTVFEEYYEKIEGRKIKGE